MRWSLPADIRHSVVVHSARASLLVIALMALSACGEPPAGRTQEVETEQVATEQVAGPVIPLMKAEGFRSDLVGQFWSLLEVAYDRATAERAWQASVRPGLEARSGEPLEPGLYGDLDSVDFRTHAVAVWSAGESGWCPGWLGDIRTTGRRVKVTVAEHMPGDGCTDDYNAYTMVVAIERARLPEKADLPITADVGPVDDGVVVDSFPSRRFTRGK